MIYADNAATTVLDKEAFEAMKTLLFQDYANPSQPYSFSRNPKKYLKQARKMIAECINADPKEIFFTSGGTESDNWAIKAPFFYQNNGSVITSKIEHHAILNSCSFLERQGIKIDYLPVTFEGIVEPETLEKSITKNTKLVSIMLANNEIGTIQPIKKLCEITHNHGVLFHTDAVQAVGHIPINVKELDVDMLSASAHKFNGPKGIGFLYIKNGSNISSFVNGGAQESNLRAGTENVASIVAMAIALKNNCNEMKNNMSKIKEIESSFIKCLDTKGINYIRNGAENHIPGNLSISLNGYEGEMLLHRLDLMGICVSTGSACDSKNTQISHVLKAIGLNMEYAKGTIRISLGKNNTIDDGISIAEALGKIINC